MSNPQKMQQQPEAEQQVKPDGEPGGRYEINGQVVDANGKPVGAKDDDAPVTVPQDTIRNMGEDQGSAEEDEPERKGGK